MSAFNIGLSGLSASSKDLDVTSNNIANAETVGFKRSRTEFADVYATTAFGKTQTQSGSGVTVQAVTQQFNQGNLNFTENSLDMGVSGRGMFVLKPNLANSDTVYTRAGAFQVNKDGYIVNSAGQYLMGYPVNSEDGTVTSSALASVEPIRIDQTAGNPRATSRIELGANLPADELGLDTTAFDPTQSGTYTSSTSVNAYDSLGNVHTVTLFFTKSTTPNQWRVDAYVDVNESADFADANKHILDDASLVFTSTGAVDQANSSFDVNSAFNLAIYDPGNGADPMFQDPDNPGNPPTLGSLDFSDMQQFSSPFSVTHLEQDGLTIGRLSGIDINDAGVIWANYSNGTAQAITKVALANFDNSQGLRQLGDTNWSETLESGEPVGGEAGTGVFGLIKAGALEQSNVDLTAELVHLIVAQRNFQANAKSIETASRITETIINVR